MQSALDKLSEFEKELFYLIGLLPNGVRKIELNELWDQQKCLAPHLLLKDLSLLIFEEDYMLVPPYFGILAQLRANYAHISKVTKFLTTKLEKVLDKKKNPYSTKLGIQDLNNMRSCVDRIKRV